MCHALDHSNNATKKLVMEQKKKNIETANMVLQLCRKLGLFC